MITGRYRRLTKTVEGMNEEQEHMRIPSVTRRQDMSRATSTGEKYGEDLVLRPHSQVKVCYFIAILQPMPHSIMYQS
jgi:hypothetical protein